MYAAFDEPRAFEHTQVLGDRGLADSDMLGDGGRPGGSPAEFVEDGASRAVCQRGEDTAGRIVVGDGCSDQACAGRVAGASGWLFGGLIHNQEVMYYITPIPTCQGLFV